MTLETATKRIESKYPQKQVKRSVLYNGHYVFLLVPKDDPNTPVFDSFFAVDKITGEISAYQPTNDRNSEKFFKIWKEGSP